jgi:phosphohistidine phosphatase SixA
MVADWLPFSQVMGGLCSSGVNINNTNNGYTKDIMTRFYLIRTGEPHWDINEQYKLKGHGRDLVPLTIKGVNHVYLTAKDERLKEAEIIVSSPYPRALQTAAILSKELPHLTFEYDSMERLKELGDDYDNNNGVYPSGVAKLWESKELLKNRVE